MVAACGAATEESSTELPPALEGLNPAQIEKIMIEEILAKPEGSGKEAFDFVKTVKPIMDQFKKQMIADKKKMQQTLDDDDAAVKECITKMEKSTKVALLEIDKKKKCPSKQSLDVCKQKIGKMGKKEDACKDLEHVGKKDLDSVLELIKQWNKQKVLKKDCVIDKGETRYHYVTRLANHFTKKLEAFEKKLRDLLKQKKHGKKLKDGCNAIRHYQRKLKEVTCEKIEVALYKCSCGNVDKEAKVCKMYDECFSASVENKKNNEKEIKKKNAAAKLEWRAVGRIECLIKVMSGKDNKEKANAKQLEICVDPEAPQVSTKPLDLKYYAKRDKPDCALKDLNDDIRNMCKKGAGGHKKKGKK